MTATPNTSKPKTNASSSPRVKILDQVVIGRSLNLDLCEDAIHITPDFIAVIDGASSFTAKTNTVPPTPGRIATDLIKNAINAFPPTIKARDAINALTVAIATNNIFPLNDVPAAAVTIVSISRREIWQVGSTAFMEIGHQDTPVQRPYPLDIPMARLRAGYIRHLLTTTGIPSEILAETDPARDLILPFLRANVTNRNSLGPDGYGAITNTRVPDEHLIIYPIKGETGKAEIIIHTDGYPATKLTLASAETHLNNLLVEDPLCIGPLVDVKGKHPKDVSYDDRAYLRVKL